MHFVPPMDECIKTVGNAIVFMAMDAKWRYLQIPVTEEDLNETAFTCHAGSYHFQPKLFRLTNAPNIFQGAINILLNRSKLRSCLVYMDDIIIFSNNLGDHLTPSRGRFDRNLRCGSSSQAEEVRGFHGYDEKSGTYYPSETVDDRESSSQVPR